MKDCELLFGESANSHQGYGQRIAHRHRDCRAAGGGDRDIVGFAGDIGIEHDLTAQCEGTVWVSGEGDDGNA